MSTRNAGAMASPVDVPPTRPSRPGRTHHQGRGISPLSNAWKGFSTCSNLSIILHHAAGLHRHVSGEGLVYALDTFDLSVEDMKCIYDVVLIVPLRGEEEVQTE